MDCLLIDTNQVDEEKDMQPRWGGPGDEGQEEGGTGNEAGR